MEEKEIQEQTNKEVKTEVQSTDNNHYNKSNHDNKRNSRKRKPRAKEKKEFQDEVIDIRTVCKVNKGGRQRRFSVTVVVGDRKGRVGVASATSAEIPIAISKAVNKATKNMVKVDIVDGRTISHEVVCKKGSTRVFLKPAKKGIGLVAGGAVRTVLDLAGYKDVIAKSYGSRTKKNTADATVEALKMQRSAEHIKNLKSNIEDTPKEEVEEDK